MVRESTPTLLQRQVDRSPRPGKTQPDPGRLAAGGAQLRVKAAGAAALAPPLGRPAPMTPRPSDARKPSGLGCLSRSSATSGPERPVHCGTPEPAAEAALTPGGRVQKPAQGWRGESAGTRRGRGGAGHFWDSCELAWVTCCSHLNLCFSKCLGPPLPGSDISKKNKKLSVSEKLFKLGKVILKS